MRRGSRSGPRDETANATPTFAASVCAVVVRPAALRTMALRRGRTARTRPSERPTQSPTPTSRPSCISRPGSRERTGPRSVQTSKAPRWTAATRPGTRPGSRFSASSSFQPSSRKSNPGNAKLLHARWDAARVPQKERPALGQEDQGGGTSKHHLFRTSYRRGLTQVTAAMHARQITPNLIQLTRLRFVNAFLVREDDGFTLVDTTVARSGDALIEAAQDAGAPIRRIAVTHGHGDHVGSLDELRGRLDGHVQVAMPELDARINAGKSVVDDKLPGSWPELETEPDVLLEPGDRVGSLEVIEAPGHTPGHVAFLDTRDRQLIAGDVLTTLGGVAVSSHFTLPFPIASMATWDKELNLESARRLRTLEPRVLATGHGPALREPGKATVRAIERAHRALC